jgi:predicted metallo-beta-lactamase superfamily hydrolase
MEISILGTESLGVRGMSCLVKTDQRRILIDPGVALGYMRGGLLPHPRQVAVGARVRSRILEELESATDIVISHYHGDHVPLRRPTPYQIPLSSLPPLKDASFWCKGTAGLSAQSVQRHDELADHLGRPLSSAEGSDDGTIHCSHAVFHGSPASPLGTVMMTRVTDGKQSFIHASDIQLLNEEAVAIIFGWHPTIAFISGPPLYLPQITVKERIIALNNARFLAETIPVLIIDHHLLRSVEGRRWLEELKDATGSTVLSAAEFMGRQPLLLEARREELYRMMPVPADWHERYGRGEIGTEGYGEDE